MSISADKVIRVSLKCAAENGGGDAAQLAENMSPDSLMEPSRSGKARLEAGGAGNFFRPAEGKAVRNESVKIEEGRRSPSPPPHLSAFVEVQDGGNQVLASPLGSQRRDDQIPPPFHPFPPVNTGALLRVCS